MGAFGDHSRKRPGRVTDTVPAARVVPTHLGLKDKTPPGIGVGGREPDIHGPPAPVSGRHLSLIPLVGAFGDHSRERPGRVTDTFPAARVVPTHLGLKDKTPPGIGVEGREPDIHGPPAPGHIDIINSSCITLDESEGIGILNNCLSFRGIPNRLLHD